MQTKIRKDEVRKLVGKQVTAIKKDGTAITGKLVRISGNTLFMAPKKGKNVQTKAIVPLVLFDLLAIGTAPYAFGGFGYPYGGYGYGGFGGGYGGFGGFGPGFW